jgi:hypothetical protein
LAWIWSLKIFRVTVGSSPCLVAIAAAESSSVFSRAGTSTGDGVPYFAVETKSAVFSRCASRLISGSRESPRPVACWADETVGADVAAFAVPVAMRASEKGAIAANTMKFRTCFLTCQSWAIA